jgi:hypothetical protein
MKSKRKKSITIEESGVKVRLFKRGEHYWLDARNGDKRTRVPAKTSDRAVAESHARQLARQIATQQLLGVTAESLTLGELFGAYDQHKGQSLEGQWKRAIETRTKLFFAAWGASTPVTAISQTNVDSYSAGRRKRFAEKLVDGKPRTLRDGALDCDFRWLSSVFNWATRHKLPNGKRLLTHNPLHDCKWPRERNIRRPIASHDRYLRTIEKADRVDPRGRFRAILSLARYTGRRESAILELRASDILLSSDRVAKALAAAGMDERLADHMPHGAIRWSAESDKQGILHITPISTDVRTELERYFAMNPRGLGDVPLFPSVDHPDQTISRSLATKWLVRAEKLGELPKLTGGIYHPYRRLWATERKNLPDVDVAAAGGWTGVKAMRLAYQQSTPTGVLAAVLNAG